MKLVLFLAILLSSCAARDWRSASRDSAGLAPLPEAHPEAVVQVYAARTFGWRAPFAVHTWIATKEKGAGDYTTYHVIGWRARRGQSVVAVETDIPDRAWFGAQPYLVSELRGARAESAIPKIQQAAKDYPYPDRYQAYPGPNSNTFVSFVLRRVSELGVELPPHAIGKDWINEGQFFGFTESGTGVQVSFYALLGLSVGAAEGIEANILGLNFGVDFWRPALKLPLLGRVGFRDAPIEAFTHE